ncbi:MAG TPA: glycosyltransferase family 87 protein [Propionibacteriaceae bacterium]|nr:glycosyltransferase family 87 protein [Propionibacteriaceae bacterium]
MDDAPTSTAVADRRAAPPRVKLVLALLPMGALMLSLSRGKTLDFDIYRNALIAMLHGQSVYTYKMYWDAGHVWLGFLYPPFAALLMSPFALLPRTPGVMILALLTALLVVASLVVLVETINGRRAHDGASTIGPLKVVVVATPLALALPTISNMALGQVSFALWALVLLDVIVLPPRWKGLLVGLAGAIKLTPMILVPYYLVTRQWRPAITSTAAFVAATLVGAVFRWSDTLTYWLHPSVIDSSLGNLARVDNWSIYGSLARLSVGGTALTLTWLALSAGVGLGALWRARRHHLTGEEPEAAVVMGLAASLVSVATWPHHLLFLVVAIALLAWQRPLLGVPTLLLAVLPALASLAGLPPVPQSLEGHVAVVFMVIVVLAGLPTAGGARRERRAERAEPSMAGR